MYSITIHWILSVKQTSYTLTMLGWERTAIALDSFLNRRMKSSFERNSSRRILTATTRPSMWSKAR